MIPVYKPYLPSNSLLQAHQALDSTWLSSQGEYLPIVQEKLRELLNVKYIIPLNNGTSAMHLVARTLANHLGHAPSSKHKIKLIVPNNVYVAAWNAFLFDQEYQLIPIDADLNTWNIDLKQLDKKIKRYPEAAVLIVHNIGNIINVPELQTKYPNTMFVEDNCEGFLGTYHGQQAGTASFASAISFFGNKNITCGEGGAYLTNDEESYLFAKRMQGQGQSDKRFVHTQLGYNYRMTNIAAALLSSQLDLLPEIMDKKTKIFNAYRAAFDGRKDIKVQSIAPDTTHSNWMFGVRALKQTNYEQAEQWFAIRDIEVRPMFYSITTHQHLTKRRDIYQVKTTNADRLQAQCFILPSFPDLTSAEVETIIDTTNQYIQTIGE